MINALFLITFPNSFHGFEDYLDVFDVFNACVISILEGGESGSRVINQKFGSFIFKFGGIAPPDPRTEGIPKTLDGLRNNLLKYTERALFSEKEI